MQLSKDRIPTAPKGSTRWCGQNAPDRLITSDKPMLRSISKHYRKDVEMHIAALNHATRNIAPDRMHAYVLGQLRWPAPP